MLLRINIRAVIFALLSAFLCLSIGQRLAWVRAQPYPPSTDGFFYLQEFSVRLATGTSYYGTHGFFFDAGALIGRVFQLSPEALYAVMLWISITAFALALAFLVAHRSLWWLVPGPPAAFIYSDILFFRHYAFLQQGFAFSMLALGLAAAVNRKPVLAGLGLLVGATSHLLAALCAACCLPALVPKHLRPAASLLALFLLGTGLVYAIADNRPLFSLAEQLSPGWVALCRFAACSSREWTEVWIGAAMALYLITVLCFTRDRPPLLTTLLAVYVVFNLPIWTITGHMAYRLSASSLWIMLLALCMWPRQQTALTLPFRTTSLAVFITILLGAATQLSGKAYTDPFFAPSVLRNNAAALKAVLPPTTFIRARHGLQFRITYYLNRAAAKEWPSETRYEHYYELTSRSRRKRCVSINELAQPLPNCIALDNGYALMRRPLQP